MAKRNFMLWTFVAYAILAIVAGATTAKPVRVFIHGLWFDGTDFVERTVIARNGSLEFVRTGPANAESIDLQGGYVVPPFCEGHNHNIAVGKPEERNTKYMNAGVFYVLILNDAPQMAVTEKEYWERPDTVDVAFAHGGITGKGGHPVELLEGILKGGGYPKGTQLSDHAYFEVESVEQLERKWPLVKGFHPDIVKLFLQYSEEYDKRKNDPAFYGNRGVSPEVFRKAVDLAHRDGLRVAAHVVSASDFHLAIQAGTDVIAHLPGYLTVETMDPADARTAKEKKIVVITTTSLASTLGKKSFVAIQAAQKSNLKLLKDAGVTLVIGSDSWSDTSRGEVDYLRSLGIFSELELLRMWTQNCASTVFPSRRIGRLEPGFDADFLVLEGNPIKDFEAIRRIKLRVKNGQTIQN